MSSKIGGAIREISRMDALAKQDRWMNRLHPLVKLYCTLLFIILAVSYSRYDLAGLISMMIYPLILFNISEISFRDSLRRLRVVLPLVCVIGIFNPLFDKDAALQIGTLTVTGGVLSMLSLMLKGVLTVLASYLLIATTPIEEICRALRMLHVPKLLVTEILLIYRYITVLLQEAERVTQAYALRAPEQNGVAWRAWGPLVGQMLLRSMDRAGRLYESMCMRGFHGEFPEGKHRSMRVTDLAWAVIWTAIFLLLRFLHAAQLLGGMIL